MSSYIKKIYPFLIRNNELESALNFLTESDNSSLILISGDSGTGKTFFAKEILYKSIELKKEKVFTLYIDVADDIHESSQILSYILTSMTLPSKYNRFLPINILKEFSYDTYLQQNTQRETVGKSVIELLSGLINYLGFGKVINSLSKNTELSLSIEVRLQHYLIWLSKKIPIVIVIDNYQFLNFENRITIETIVERINKYLKVIIIDRTDNSHSTISPPVNCFLDNRKIINLSKFSNEETKIIVTKLINNNEAIEKISNDIFIKSGGLAKDIQYCIDKYLLEKEKGISEHSVEDLLSTIDKLPLMHRQFLLIASLLNGGVKKKYALNVIKNIYQIVDDNEINQTLEDLILREYLKINSITKDRVLPGHERIVKVMQQIIDIDIHEEVRISLIHELEIIINSNNIEDNETYLLHCFIGLHNTQELIKNLSYIIRLIDAKYRQEDFRYLVTFIEEMGDLTLMLPEEIILLILDAHQKDSSFNKGINFIHKLEGHISSKKLNIFKFKFLIQSYHYKSALEMVRLLEENIWKDIYLLNIYLALEENQSALEIFNNAINNKMNEEQAILLRNSPTLFNSKKAIQNLKKSKEYFEYVTGSEFRIATVENNMGLVYFNEMNYGDALKIFESALARFNSINSNEAYQVYINLSVYYTKLGKFKNALLYLDKAKLMVPVSLLLDRVKIDVNILIIEYLADKIDIIELKNKLITQLEKIKNIEMPYMRTVINHNINMCTSSSSISLQNEKNVSLVIGIDDLKLKKQWYLLMSIHWRY